MYTARSKRSVADKRYVYVWTRPITCMEAKGLEGAELPESGGAAEGIPDDNVRVVKALLQQGRGSASLGEGIRKLHAP